MSALFDMRDIFCGFLFAFRHTELRLKRDVLWKEIVCSWEYILSFRVDPFSDGKHKPFCLLKVYPYPYIEKLLSYMST